MILLAAALALAPPATPPAPAKPSGSGYQEIVRVDLVQLNFLAADSRGNPVTDLKPEEVEVFQGRRKQTIAFLQPYYTPRARSVPAAIEPLTPGLPAHEPAALPDPKAGAVTPGRWLILFFDSYTASPATRVRATEAARTFLATGIHAGDQVAVIVFDGKLQAIQNFTADPVKLEAAAIRASEDTERAGGDRSVAISSLMDNMDNCRDSGDPGGCAQRAAASYSDDKVREADALLRSLILYVRSLTPIPDIKTLVLFSEGFSRNPASDSYDVATVTLGTSVASRLINQPEWRIEQRLDDLTEAAASSRTSVFTVNPGAGSRVSSVSAARHTQLSELSNPAQIDVYRRAEQNNRFGLSEIARLTGGKASEAADVGKALREVVDLAPGLYTVGYYPSENDGEAHDVRIRVKRKGVEVDAHRLVPLAPTMPPITGALTITPGPCGAEGRRQSVLSLRLDRNRLVFEKVDRRLSANFSVFIRMLADGQGEPVYQDFRFFNITNSPDEVAAGGVPDPLLELTLAMPCRPLTLLVSVVDAAGGGRGEFQTTIAP